MKFFHIQVMGFHNCCPYICLFLHKKKHGHSNQPSKSLSAGEVRSLREIVTKTPPTLHAKTTMTIKKSLHIHQCFAFVEYVYDIHLYNVYNCVYANICIYTHHMLNCISMLFLVVQPEVPKLQRLRRRPQRWPLET